jgi:SAM-dependent methyltransferase
VTDAEVDRVLRSYSEMRPGSRTATLRRVLDAVHSGGDGADAEFDHAYPRWIRALSASFWTPVRVAVRAAALLVAKPGARVLDVGSGVGKFCIVGAAATGATFTGVEHRWRLVSMATRAAGAFGVESARFRCAPFDTLDATSFDGIYLFNPFEENLCDPWERVDDTVLLSRERFARDTVRAECMLASSRVGTRVVTYNGFGSGMPHGFRLDLRERHGRGILELWEKTEHAPWPPRRRAWSLLHSLRVRTLRALQAAYRDEAFARRESSYDHGCTPGELCHFDASHSYESQQ